MKEIVDTFQIGLTTESQEPRHLATLIHEMLYNDSLRQEWRENLEKAARELCWEKEKEKLLNLYRKAQLL
jgi:glycosyltransferase involved in cell wall biosynthesis